MRPSPRRQPMPLRAALWLLLSLAGTHSAANPAAATPLRLDEAMQLAAAYSRALPAQAQAVLAARERAVAAAQRPDPVLRIGLDNVPITGSADSLLTREAMTARSLGLSQTLTSADKRASRAKVFEHEADTGQRRRALVQRDLQREAALAWWQVHADQQRLAWLDRQRAEAELSQQAADAAWRGGRGSAADLFAARSALARLDEQRIAASARHDQARTSLRRWLGDDGARPLAAPPSLPDLLSALWPARLQPAAAGDTAPADSRLADDPELKLAEARIRLAEAAAEQARQEREADWSLDLRFAQRGPRFDNMLTLGLSIPLRWDLPQRQDRELAARLASVAQAQDEAEELRRARDAELTRWWQRWQAGLARLAAYDSRLLPLAADREHAALAAYRAGAGPLQTVLDARQAQLRLQLERLQIETDTASDGLRLATLMPAEENTR